MCIFMCARSMGRLIGVRFQLVKLLARAHRVLRWLFAVAQRVAVGAKSALKLLKNANQTLHQVRHMSR